jgi:DNA-binding MarR family transcriptional regulator
MVKNEECIVFLLAKAYQSAHSNMKKHLSQYGLTPVQILVLEAIRREEGSSATEIGKKVSLDSATLSGVLDRMAERDWVIKEVDKEDKRSLRLFLGEKARVHQNELILARKRSNEEILNGFSIEERVLLKRLLKDMNR